MKRRITLALAFVLAAGLVCAENYYLSVSATTTSATKMLPKYSDSVMLCNAAASANIAYVRLYTVIDVDNGATGAATSSSSDIAIGACKSWTRGSGKPQWAAVAIISAGTSTVTIDAD